LSKKIRTAQLLQTNYICTIGNREVESRSLAVRGRDPSQQISGSLQIAAFVDALQQSVNVFK